MRVRNQLLEFARSCEIIMENNCNYFTSFRCYSASLLVASTDPETVVQFNLIFGANQYEQFHEAANSWR